MLAVTFVPLGMLFYVLIGLPCSGIIAGWIIARDNIMGVESDDEADRDEQWPSGPNT